jgi:hypothetical protein
LTGVGSPGLDLSLAQVTVCVCVCVVCVWGTRRSVHLPSASENWMSLFVAVVVAVVVIVVDLLLIMLAEAREPRV